MRVMLLRILVIVAIVCSAIISKPGNLAAQQGHLPAQSRTRIFLRATIGNLEQQGLDAGIRSCNLTGTAKQVEVRRYHVISVALPEDHTNAADIEARRHRGER